MAVTNPKGQGRKSDTPAASAPQADPFPRPWTKPEDREGWEVIARGQGRKDRPPVGTAIIVSLSREQSSWVREQADTSGLSMEQFVARLIDEARGAT